MPSFTPRSDVNFDSKLADRNRNEGASKVSGGSNADVGGAELLGYGGAVDAHKTSLKRKQ